MARIRSIHPGQWTDEQFVMCSPWAQLLCIAIRNEADDAGLFEWKPIGLKMRLLPAASVDVAALLAELAEAGLLMRYEHGGKPYGAIKNFGKWQSPKKPSRKHPATAEVLAYTAYENPEDLGDSGGNNGGNCPKQAPSAPRDPEPIDECTKLVPNQYGTGGEKSRQRERDREKERESEDTPQTPRPDPESSSEPAPPLSADADVIDSEPEFELVMPEPVPIQTGTVLVAYGSTPGLPVKFPKYAAEFAEFWAVYPRKKAKGAAERAWAKAVKLVDPAELMARLRAQIPVMMLKPQFIPHPATWLNGKRWEDEISSHDLMPDPRSGVVGSLAYLANMDKFNGTEELNGMSDYERELLSRPAWQDALEGPKH